MTSKAISSTMGDLLKKIRTRDPYTRLSVGSGRYEFKRIHGFRKYFKTSAERSIKTIDVEKLICHAENFKPSDECLLWQYLKAVSNLAISETDGLRDKMQKQAAVSDKKMGEI